MSTNFKIKDDNLYSNSKSKFQIVLNDLMISRGITAAKLSKATQIPPPTISKFLSGSIEDPKFSTLSALSKFFSVSTDQLMGIVPILKNNTNHNHIESISLPIISWKESIVHKDLILTLDENNWNDWILTEKPISKFAFGLKTKLNMEPRFPTGSVLIIEPDIEIYDGDLVVVQYKDVNEATIREIIIDGSKRKFLSLNNNFTLENNDDDIIILGVVVKTIFSYKERKK